MLMEKDFYKIIAIGVLSCVVYSNIHSGPFLHDDVSAILNNPDVQETRPWSNIWLNDFWGTPMNHRTSHRSYRPIVISFFRLLHTLWGNWTTPYHIFNILFHAIVSVLFFLVCRKIVFGSFSTTLSFIAALLFAMHPIHTEAVCGIVGLAEILSACCFLLAILTYSRGLDTESTLKQSETKSSEPIENIRSNKNDSNSAPGELKTENIDTELRKRKNVENTSELSPNSNDTTLSETASTMEYLTAFSHDLKMLLCPFLLAAMSMLCKESGVTVMAIFVVYELVKKKSQLKASEVDFTNLLDVHLISRIVCIAIWLVVLLVFRMWMMEWRQPGFAKVQNPAAWTEEKMTRILTHLYLCWFNFRLLLYPVNLSYDYLGNTIPLITTIWDLRNVATLVFFILCVGGGIVCLYCLLNKTDWANTFLMGYALLVVPFIPASNLFFPVGFVVAERVLYTPSCGFIILVVLTGQILYETFPSKRKIVHIATVVIMVFYFLRTYDQNFNWTSRKNFAKAGVQAYPENGNMRYNWGVILQDDKRYIQASFEYEEAIRLDPMNFKAYNNLATIWETLNKPLNEVEKLFVKALEVGPKEDRGFSNIANILLKQNRSEDAIKVMGQALTEVNGPITYLIKIARITNNLHHTSRTKNLYFNLMKKNCMQSIDENVCLIGCLPALEEHAKQLLEKDNKRLQGTLLQKEIERIKLNNAESVNKLLKTFAESYNIDQLVTGLTGT